MQFILNFGIRAGECINCFIIRKLSLLVFSPIGRHGRCLYDPFDHRSVKTLLRKKLLKPERSQYIAYVKNYISYHFLSLPIYDLLNFSFFSCFPCYQLLFSHIFFRIYSFDLMIPFRVTFSLPSCVSPASFSRLEVSSVFEVIIMILLIQVMKTFSLSLVDKTEI